MKKSKTTKRPVKNIKESSSKPLEKTNSKNSTIEKAPAPRAEQAP